jgi:O-antigen/teichoic acid export membrane protein
VGIGKLQKETSWAALTKGSTLVLFVLINASLTRAMGRVAFGTWSYFFATLNIIYLISLMGVNDSTRIFVARVREGDIRAPIRGGLLLRLAASGIFAAGLLLGGPYLASAQQRPEFATLFQWSALLIIGQGLVEFLKAVFEGLHRLKYNFVVNMLEYGGKLLLVGLLVGAIPASGSALAAFIAATLVTSLIGIVLLYAFFYHCSPRESSASPIGQIALYALPMLTVTVGFALAIEMDTIMLGWLAGDAEVGKYAAAKEFAAKLLHGGVVLAMGTLQVFAGSIDGRAAYLRRLAHRLVLMIGVLSAGLCAGILLFADWFMPLIFGREFDVSAEPLKLLTPFIFVYSVSRVLSGIMDYRGKAWRRAAYLGLSVGVNFLLNLALIPRYGANGACIASSVSYFPYLVLNYLEVRRSLREGESDARASDIEGGSLP